eukprot:TRINITY_DN43072_c0_g1_i1.p1 TRINITY_DN43072_c0_g1~~TRINITY_DN43072_c0_g1_i1.p1  ORF type:complete len:1036 (-),score=219.78 TRINITY_DN43072_c0_g1_i1:105-3212(-)
MALVGPGAMTEYTGGPSRGRARGYVSVNEPAQGFFVTGSSINAVNGVYGRVNPGSVWSPHTVLLAYRNDDAPSWVMALVELEPGTAPQKKRPQRFCRRRHGLDSDSDDVEERREWLLVDANGRDRFAHEGDTIIPGAGVSWKHLHRGAKKPEKKTEKKKKKKILAKRRRNGSSSSSSSDSVICEELQASSNSSDSSSDAEPDPAEVSTALETQGEDDEDELPWQVIAILDRQTMRDIRYTQRCYEANIKAAVSGVNLPKPALGNVDATPGCWVYKVARTAGVEVHVSPKPTSPVVGWRDRGECLKVVERRDGWLRLLAAEDDSEDDVETEALWVLAEEKDGSPRLIYMAEEDMPSMETNLPEQPEADVFDRPFEPRLEDPNVKEEAEETAEEMDPGKTIPCQDAPSQPLPVLPAPEEELAIGTEVTLEGLSKETFNGEAATVVTQATADGRQGVRLKDGKKISIKVMNLRPVVAGESGPLARHARVLGLNLAMLGLDVAEGSAASPPPTRKCAEELIGAAVRAAQRDLHDDANGAHCDVQVAHEALVGALAQRASDVPSADADVKPSVSSAAFAKAPHEAVESGALGARAASAAQLASCADSLAKVEEGVSALRQLMIDEQSRRRNAKKQASRSNGTDDGGDSLRLRLTLVRALLRCRRESEASAEASVAARLHSDCAAAFLWHGRCLLRAGKRDEGIASLTLAATPGGTDGAWAALEAKRRLQAIRGMQSCERRAKDAYARGLFPDAARIYGQAIDCAGIVGDDKWSRAELHSNRAACQRRAREFSKAVADLDVALSLFPRYKRALFRRGVCLLEAGSPNDAVVAFETLLGLDRVWPNMLEWLVRAHAQQQRQGGKTGSAGFGESSGGRCSNGAPSVPSFADAGNWAEAMGEKDVAAQKNHYTVLGVPTDATEKQLKRAYRTMSLKFHPDKEGGSTRAFQRVASAYETLSDPEKRQLYDEGADLKDRGANNDSDSDDEREHKSLRERIERKYFPERYKFWPFGDPFIQKRKRQERLRQRAGRPAWFEDDDLTLP